ncbi:hypothetical protein, partial [Halodesulfovibrio sp.]|uniref:hypothetical protein n=1 Tax=Halodesulfovibrio sp. TaxID=1912772 RepID=UPI0025FD8AC7
NACFASFFIRCLLTTHMVALVEKEGLRRRIPNAHMLMMLKKVFDDAAAGFKRSPTALPRALRTFLEERSQRLATMCLRRPNYNLQKEGSLDSPRTFTREVSTFLTLPRGLRTTTLRN